MKNVFLTIIYCICAAGLSFGQSDDAILRKNIVGTYEDSWIDEDKMLNVKVSISYTGKDSYTANNIYECRGDMAITAMKGKTTVNLYYVLSVAGKYHINKGMLIVDCLPDNISFTPKLKETDDKTTTAMYEMINKMIIADMKKEMQHDESKIVFLDSVRLVLLSDGEEITYRRIK